MERREGWFFKATRSKRESRFWNRWAHRPKRSRIRGEAEGERLAERGGGGSCFERFHSSMVPDYPSFCYRTKPPSAFTAAPVPPFNPAGVLVLLRLHRLLSAAIRVLVIRRHRPSIFLFDRFFPGGRAAATDAPAAVALCMCSLACIRCESWTRLFGCTVFQKDRALTWMHFQPGKPLLLPMPLVMLLLLLLLRNGYRCWLVATTGACYLRSYG